MIEVPRTVKKLGGSWVVKLDKDTRRVLGVKKIGDVVILKGGDNKDGPTSEDVSSTE